MGRVIPFFLGGGFNFDPYVGGKPKGSENGTAANPLTV